MEACLHEADGKRTFVCRDDMRLGDVARISGVHIDGGILPTPGAAGSAEPRYLRTIFRGVN